MECKLLWGQDGGARIRIDDKTLSPVAYMTYAPEAERFASFRADGLKLYSIGIYAGDQGINSHSGLRPFRSGLFRGPGRYDFDEVAQDLARIAPTGKEAYILPRIYLDCPKWWEAEHPEELCRDYRGNALRESFASEKWREDMGGALEALIDFIEASPWKNAVIGYQVAAGGTEEWVYHRRFFTQYADYSAVNHRRYSRWLRDSYETVEALNRSWGTDYEDFDRIPLPTPLERVCCRGGVLRDFRTERPVMDYYVYHSELIADAILYFCRRVKAYTHGDRLTGAFYGYVGEIMNVDYGHHALGKVLQSPDIDFLASPNSYFGCRAKGEDWPYMAPVDSARLHGKLWFVESDTRTHLTRPMKETLPQCAPDNTLYENGVWAGPETKELSLALLKKGIARVLTGRTGTWWFDMWGGWFDAPEYRELLQKAEGWIGDQSTGLMRAETAVLVDDRAFASFGVDDPVLYDLIYKQRSPLGKMGAPYDFYLLSDLADGRFPAEAYKAVIFLNAVNLEEPVKQAIREKLQKDDRLLLWIYLADAANGGVFTGFPWVYTPDRMGQAIYKGAAFPEKPVSCAAFTPEAAEGAYVLASTDDGRPAVLFRREKAYTAAYSLLPCLPARLLNDLLALNGVHVYCFTEDVVYAGGQYIAIHAASGGEKRLYLPQGVTKATDAETGKPQRVNGCFLDFPMEQYETRVFRLEE